VARRILVLTVMLGTVVALAGPASAKGISFAHFSGPGLPPGGVSIHGEHSVLWETGAMTDGHGLSPEQMGLSRSDLGPAYRGELAFDWAPNKPVRILIYPYAPGGPRTLTLPGQRIDANNPISSGWYHGSSRLLRFLITNGFPSRASLPEPSPSPRVVATPAADVEQATAGSGSMWVWLVAGALALALVLTVTVARRFRRPFDRA
jgi:hypothetical protein